MTFLQNPNKLHDDIKNLWYVCLKAMLQVIFSMNLLYSINMNRLSSMEST